MERTAGKGFGPPPQNNSKWIVITLIQDHAGEGRMCQLWVMINVL